MGGSHSTQTAVVPSLPFEYSLPPFRRYYARTEQPQQQLNQRFYDSYVSRLASRGSTTDGAQSPVTIHDIRGDFGPLPEESDDDTTCPISVTDDSSLDLHRFAASQLPDASRKSCGRKHCHRLKSFTASLFHRSGTKVSGSNSMFSGFSIASFRSLVSSNNSMDNFLHPAMSLKDDLKLTLDVTSVGRCKSRCFCASLRFSFSASISSLNSLSDGRTPWPIPWLEGIFLPEFPNKGPLISAFQIIGIIAKGKFGTVYRAKLKCATTSFFAVKVQNKSHVLSENAVQQVKDEVTIHRLLSGLSFVCNLYGTWQTRSQLFMGKLLCLKSQFLTSCALALEYVPGCCDLHEFWFENKPLSEKLVKIWAAELATVLNCIHRRNIVYRDLKMENIMLDDKGHIQLIDFGLSKWLDSTSKTRTICGTLQYMGKIWTKQEHICIYLITAPEILSGLGYSHAVDWWSLGVLLHVLLTGLYPFTVESVHNFSSEGDYIPPAKLSSEFQSLLRKLLCKNQFDRLQTLQAFRGEKLFSDSCNDRDLFNDMEVRKVVVYYVPD
ncbi:unnamed protein product [Soboliphyme baturini]|uniref:Protein kinase domain-containing protein n=1 Tax=Soboliphyme baturini TaxID=241478 RepID=A0A183IX35_9BILA|nr:unnamed protein product [Soboliphyme baturini]